MLQDDCIFACVYLTQEEGWHSVRETIITHTNSFSKQQEQEGIILPNKRMTVTSLLHQLNAEDLTGGIVKEKNQVESNNSTPLIKDLEISNIFKNKDNKEGNGVTNKLINKISQLLMLVGLVAQQIRDIVTGQVQVSHK